MPFIVPLLPLIAAGVGAAGVGTSIYEGIKSSDEQKAAQAADQKALLAQQQAQANQANLSKQEAVLGAQGQTQQQTGGSLTDPGTSALTDLLAGYPGYQSGGTGGGGTSAGTSGTSGVNSTAGSSSPTGSPTGTPDIAAILAALTNGGAGGPGAGSNSTSLALSGGNWQIPLAQSQARFELASPVV